MSVKSELCLMESLPIENLSDTFCCSLCEGEYCVEEKLRCVSCDYVDLCETCVKSHLKKSHDVIDTLGRNPASCHKHYLLLTLYCEDCNVAFCQACSEKHSSHVFVNVHSKASQFRREVFELIDRSELLTKPLKKHSDDVSELKSSFTTRGDLAALQTDVVLEALKPSVNEVVAKLKKFDGKKESSFSNTLDELKKQSDENDELTCTLKSWLSSNDTQLVRRFIDEIDSVNSKLSRFREETENLRCIISSKQSNRRTEAGKKLVDAIEEFVLPTDNHRMISNAKKKSRLTCVKDSLGPFEQYIKTPDFVLALSNGQPEVNVLTSNSINELAVNDSKSFILDSKLKYRYTSIDQNFLVFFEFSEISNSVRMHYKDLKTVGIGLFGDSISFGSNKYLFSKPKKILTEDRVFGFAKRRTENGNSVLGTSKDATLKSSGWSQNENNSKSPLLSAASGLFGGNKNKRVFGQSSSTSENPSGRDQSFTFASPKVLKLTDNSNAPLNFRERQDNACRLDAIFNRSTSRSISTPLLQPERKHVDFACEEVDLAFCDGSLDNMLAVRFLPPKPTRVVNLIEYIYWHDERKAILSSVNNNLKISFEKRPNAFYICDDIAVTVENKPEFIDCSIFAVSDCELMQFETNKVSIRRTSDETSDDKWQIVVYRNMNNDRFLLLVNMSTGSLFVLRQQTFALESVDCGFRWSLLDAIDLGIKALTPLKLLIVKWMVYKEASNDLQYKIVCVTNENSVFRCESQ